MVKKIVSKKEKPLEVYFCPQCRSVSVRYIFSLKNLFGVIQKMRCSDCGYVSSIFPIGVVDKKVLKKKVATKKVAKKNKSGRNKK